jgi:hypothetical protein
MMFYGFISITLTEEQAHAELSLQCRGKAVFDNLPFQQINCFSSSDMRELSNFHLHLYLFPLLKCVLIFLLENF